MLTFLEISLILALYLVGRVAWLTVQSARDEWRGLASESKERC
jgi:hypothetical protein